MNHYFLVSSLPALLPGERPRITRGDFLRLAAEHLDAADLELLGERLADKFPAGDDTLSREWRAVETSLRNACVRQRSARLGVDARSHLRPGDDRSFDAAVAAAFNTPDPLARENALDAVRLAALEGLAGFDPFTFRALQCYALRLHLHWRRSERDADRGRAHAARLAGLPEPEPAGVPTP